MGAGAAGAVFVAAVGVAGVFKLAFWVAGEAGRSMRPGAGEAEAAAAGTPPPAAASPLERGAWAAARARWARGVASGATARVPGADDARLRPSIVSVAS
jgi:hypothetical protein